MYKIFMLLFATTMMLYATCSFTMVDLKKDVYQKECIDKKILSNKHCSKLQSYIKKCGVVVTEFNLKVHPDGQVKVIKK